LKVVQESGLKGFMGLEVNPEADYGDPAFQPIQVFPETAVGGCFSPIILAFFRGRQQFPPPLRLFFTRNSCIPAKPETISCFSRRHFKTGQAGSTSRNSESTSPEFKLKKAEMKK